jgi:hypothetical protein
VKKNPDVDRWFTEKKLPNPGAMQRVRNIFLSADARMSEKVQYGTVVFSSVDDMASFVQVAKKPVTLMFNRGQLIEKGHPHLEGSGPNARFMRFADEAEVDARAKELTSLARAWCSLMAGGPKAVKVAATEASARRKK